LTRILNLGSTPIDPIDRTPIDRLVFWFVTQLIDQLQKVLPGSLPDPG